MKAPTGRTGPAARALWAAACCLLLAPLAGCDDGGRGGGTQRGRAEPSASARVPGPPPASRAPARGTGSQDPDDLNGDGHRDLVLPVPAAGVAGAAADPGAHQRLAVVYGSARGLDPATRAVYGRRALGLPASAHAPAATGFVDVDAVAAADAVTADLDGDGFPDVVTDVAGETATEGRLSTVRTVPYASWGGPAGPVPGRRATALRLPATVATLGLGPLVRGDFDGDGHHDLAAPAQNHSSLVVLYGPFSRAGAPARTDTRLPWRDGALAADAVATSGRPRATALLVHGGGDGEQSASVLYAAHAGTGLSASGRRLRPGNAHAFGDFDGDGARDVAVGDDGGRNDEPGHETEDPDVAGSLAVYPVDGGPPATRRLPRVPAGAATDYGPGGFFAADPDGDGRDGLLVATYEGATLLDGDRRTPVLREGPAKVDGRPTPAKWRRARPAGAADFDGDGRDELVLHWGPGALFGLYGRYPTHWWITAGATSRDRASFSTAGFAAAPSPTGRASGS